MLNTLYQSVTEGISFEPGVMKLGSTWVKPCFHSHIRTSKHIFLKVFKMVLEVNYSSVWLF